MGCSIEELVLLSTEGSCADIRLSSWGLMCGSEIDQVDRLRLPSFDRRGFVHFVLHVPRILPANAARPSEHET